MPTITGAHHVAFTVQDLDASSGVVPGPVWSAASLQSDDENVRIRVLAHPDSGLIIGLLRVRRSRRRGLQRVPHWS